MTTRQSDAGHTPGYRSDPHVAIATRQSDACESDPVSHFRSPTSWHHRLDGLPVVLGHWHSVRARVPYCESGQGDGHRSSEGSDDEHYPAEGECCRKLGAPPRPDHLLHHRREEPNQGSREQTRPEHEPQKFGHFGVLATWVTANQGVTLEQHLVAVDTMSHPATYASMTKWRRRSADVLDLVGDSLTSV